MKDELSDALSAPELQKLLASVSGTKSRDLVERDLLRRRGEIELELSSLTAAHDEAVASWSAAYDRVRQRTKTGWHPTLRLASISVIVLAAMGYVGINLSGWSAGLNLLGSWRSPFTSGWIAAAVWALLYTSVIMAIFEADFYLRRLPARKLQADREEKIKDLQLALDETRVARHNQLIALVRDHITEILNSSRGPQFGASMRVRADANSGNRQRVTLAVGLSEVTNDDNRVSTDVQHRLLRLLGSLPGASIGISGPRGVGKSSLLAALCGANPTIDHRAAIAINTSAPVEYDGREFLLHLFSTLCRQVLRTEGQEDMIEEDRGALIEALRWRRASTLGALQPLARLLILVGATLAGIALMLAMIQSVAANELSELSPSPGNTIVATPSVTPDAVQTSLPPDDTSASNLEKAGMTQIRSSSAATSVKGAASNPFAEMFKELDPAPLFSLGVVALVFGFAALGPFGKILFRPEQHLRSYYRSERSDLVERAFQELRNIGFQRSYTSGWSGSLKVPVGVDVTSSAGLTFAQRPESLPELVERFRGFVHEVAVAYDNVVLIGIDELDKLKSAQQAEAFLNGVKSVFGIPRCFYLISVSEHALAAFERRGIGFRDAFDSSLDDIVHVDFLNLDQSRVMLNRRILRLPDPFVQLCHMLSGGLPRDLIRHARALLEFAARTSNGMLSLRGAAEEMASRDLEARVRATSIAIRTVKETAETSDLLVEIASLPSLTNVKVANDALLSFRMHLAGLDHIRDTDDGRVLLRLSEELAIYYETMILLRRIIGLLSTKKGWERSTEFGLAEHLAGVRQALEVGVPLAQVRVSELRSQVDDAALLIDRIVNPRRHRGKS